jgi:hypothetical protein
MYEVSNFATRFVRAPRSIPRSEWTLASASSFAKGFPLLFVRISETVVSVVPMPSGHVRWRAQSCSWRLMRGKPEVAAASGQAASSPSPFGGPLGGGSGWGPADRFGVAASAQTATSDGPHPSPPPVPPEGEGVVRWRECAPAASCGKDRPRNPFGFWSYLEHGFLGTSLFRAGTAHGPGTRRRQDRRVVLMTCGHVKWRPHSGSWSSRRVHDPPRLGLTLARPAIHPEIR